MEIKTTDLEASAEDLSVHLWLGNGTEMQRLPGAFDQVIIFTHPYHEPEGRWQMNVPIGSLGVAILPQFIKSLIAFCEEHKIPLDQPRPPTPQAGGLKVAKTETIKIPMPAGTTKEQAEVATNQLRAQLGMTPKGPPKLGSLPA